MKTSFHVSRGCLAQGNTSSLKERGGVWKLIGPQGAGGKFPDHGARKFGWILTGTVP